VELPPSNRSQSLLVMAVVAGMTNMTDVADMTNMTDMTNMADMTDVTDVTDVADMTAVSAMPVVPAVTAAPTSTVSGTIAAPVPTRTAPAVVIPAILPPAPEISSGGRADHVTRTLRLCRLNTEGDPREHGCRCD